MFDFRFYTALLRKLGMAFDEGLCEGRIIYLHFTDPAQCEEEILDEEEEESTEWPSNWNDWLYVPKGCREIVEETEPGFLLSLPNNPPKRNH